MSQEIAKLTEEIEAIRRDIRATIASWSTPTLRSFLQIVWEELETRGDGDNEQADHPDRL